MHQWQPTKVLQIAEPQVGIVSNSDRIVVPVENYE